MTRLDRLAIILVLFGLIASLSGRLPSVSYDPSVGRRPIPEEGGALPPSTPGLPLPGASPSDPLFSVETEAIPSDMMETGTSFAVGDGVWLTARHVANADCRFLTLNVNGHKISSKINYLHPEADLAVVQTKATTERDLEISDDPLGADQTGYSFGYPQGALGATQDRIMGRARMQLEGRLSGVGPTIAWAEVARYPADLDSIQGMSGGPMLDANGKVIGIIVATSVRRGRNYTVAPEIIRQVQQDVPALAGPGHREPAPEIAGQALSLGSVAQALAADSRIAKTYCAPG